MFPIVVFNFRVSSTSRQLGHPWDLIYPWSLLTFSWKSLKHLPSTPIQIDTSTSAHAITLASSYQSILPSSAPAIQTQQDQHIEACSKPTPQGLIYPKSNPSTCLPYLGSTSHKGKRILQQAGIKVHSAPNKLQGFLHTNNDKPDPSNIAGVYWIPCECGKIYIGDYLGSTSHKRKRILQQAGIKIHSAPNKLQGFLHTNNDKPDPSNIAGVYWIPCECGKVYIGETGRNLPTRLKEHRAHGHSKIPLSCAIAG